MMKLKKVLPICSLLLCSMIPVCSAADWKYVAQEPGTEMHYYLDKESAWYDGTEGGSITKCENKDTGYMLMDTINFINRSDGDYNATITKIKIFDANGKLVDTISTGTAGVATADSILGKICRMIIDMSKS